MARILQAFHSNPALGGFGNESGISIKEGDCDAFAQIVKELVDNAVDACRQDSEQIRRVRVDFSQVSPTVLRVTVTDNGCGMSCIQDCVEAFRSHKRNSSNQTKTAGRYGIGLTLCLLHAQRLVPNSTASITSATKTSNCFQQADYVVDTEVDCIKCIHEEEIPKSRPDESGTSVSVLVPGGPMAHRAWPRLAEYFARFQLSLGLPCSLEVMAPTLSTVPLFVRSPLERRFKNRPATNSSQRDGDEWNPDAADADSDSVSSMEVDNDIRKDIQRAVSCFLKRNVDLNNVAHSTQPIRNGKRRTKNSPTLEVDVIVYEKSSDDDDEETNNTDMPSAQMTLVRMVNRIPLLDGAEAPACGLVQCVTSQQSMWASFGLSVRHGTDLTAQDLRLFVPTYAVRDSDNVASFFQNRSPHQLFEIQEDEYEEDEDSVIERGNDDDEKPKATKRKHLLLPAHLRLGNVLLIVQIHAKPSSLPLPTLSKSRLPLNDTAIDSAVETGVMECLQSLQKTNPDILLTPKQLKTTIRDTRYIPSAAAAMACVVCKSKDENFQNHFLKMIRGWSNRETKDDSTENVSSSRRNSDAEDNDDEKEVGNDLLLEVNKLGPLLEAKLRKICSISDVGKTAMKKVTKMTTRSTNKENEAPPPVTPPRRQTSENWCDMSPSPVKMPTKKPPSTRGHRDSLDSLETGMSPSPAKKPTKPATLIRPRDSLDSLGGVLDEDSDKKALTAPRILKCDANDYADDDEEW